MTVSIISNKKLSSAVLHFNASNTLVVVGNSSQSNVAIADEVLTGAYITQAFWGCDGNGHIQVLRGANVVAIYDSTGYKDYAGSGMPINAFTAGTLVVNFTGSANAYLMIEVQKMGSFTSNSDYFKV